MTKLYMENWLSVVAGVYLLGMVLYGHHRGFIRLIVSMLAVVLSLTIVRVALPSVTGYLKENTGLQQTISESMILMAVFLLSAYRSSFHYLFFGIKNTPYL